MGKEVITFRVDKELFGLPIQEVKEVLAPMKTTRVPKAPPFVDGIVNLRGRVIPILNLRKRLGLRKAEEDGGGVILIEAQGRIAGLLVDKVEGISRVPEESIGYPESLKQGMADASYLRGVGESEQGPVVLLDARKILEVR